MLIVIQGLVNLLLIIIGIFILTLLVIGLFFIGNLSCDVHCNVKIDEVINLVYYWSRLHQMQLKERMLVKESRFLRLCFMGLHMECHQKDPLACWDFCVKFALISRNNKNHIWGCSSFLFISPLFFFFIVWSDCAACLVSKEAWATFPRQNEAMNFAKEHADVRIFSYQDHHNGQRRFLVSTYTEFWRRFPLLSFLSAMMFRINTNISCTL